MILLAFDNAFLLAEGFEEQHQQYILVNTSKPRPKGLIYELLPSTGGKLPVELQRRGHPPFISGA